MTCTARTRIGTVRLKSGGAEMRLLRFGIDDNAADTLAEVRRLLGCMGADITGWAFVAWGADMGSVARARSYAPTLPRALIPIFAAERLRSAVTEDDVMLNFESPT